MRIHWWESIRWRLALGSMLVALLATFFLTLAAIVAIITYYGVDQQQRLTDLASSSAQNIGSIYPDVFRPPRLFHAAAISLHSGLTLRYQGSEYLIVVFDTHAHVVYPSPGKRPGLQAFIAALADPRIKNANKPIYAAVSTALKGQISPGEIGGGSIIPRPFIAQPIYDGGGSNSPVVGVLVVTSHYAADNTIPPFVSAVGNAIIIAAVIVAVLAAGAAILFARTITRPLAQMTQTAHVLAEGDYGARVTVKGHGELSELAHSLNDMAAKLANDVNELRKQELWRRELIMNITHDLATPLTAIAGLSESLADGVNQSKEDYEMTGRIIARETLRLRRLVKDLHMMAKVEAGAMIPQRKEIRLAALVDEVLAVLTTEFERANVEPRNAIPYNLPPLYVDPDMLTRVFSNLCDNALRHTPSGGTITIDARMQAGYVVISITDTGEGIPAEALSRIFDRFYRADSARKSSTGGSGLGLAIVRAIIEAHGGQIWAENAAQGGARILFTLPLDSSLRPSIHEAITLPIPPVQ